MLGSGVVHGLLLPPNREVLRALARRTDTCASRVIQRGLRGVKATVLTPNRHYSHVRVKAMLAL
jgi:hypothetical protein